MPEELKPAESPEIAHLTAADPVLAGIIAVAGPHGLAADLKGTPFQALASAITHQQLNGIAARTILGRFVALLGRKGRFPQPQAVLDADAAALRAVGLSFAKIAALKDLAAKTLDGTVPSRAEIASMSDDEIVERLTSVRGIGRWTVEMMLMFQLGRADVLPIDDFGVRQGFMRVYGLRAAPHPKVLALFGERWRPYRSAAAWYLWRAIELHKKGKLPPATVLTRMPRLPRRRRKPKATRKTQAKRVEKAKRKKKRSPAQRRIARALRPQPRSRRLSTR